MIVPGTKLHFQDIGTRENDESALISADATDLAGKLRIHNVRLFEKSQGGIVSTI
jgi:hypothetical protein